MAISNFRSALEKHGGVQRKFRWRITLSFPQGAVSSEDTRDLSALATTTNTPKQTLGEILVPFGGREFPIPGDRKYEEISITFINTEDNFGHNAFELWSQLLNGDNSNTSAASLESLFSDFSMELLDQNENVVKTYTLESCWPREVGEIELDQASQDEFGTYTVSIRFFKSSSNNSR